MVQFAGSAVRSKKYLGIESKLSEFKKFLSDMKADAPYVFRAECIAELNKLAKVR